MVCFIHALVISSLLLFSPFQLVDANTGTPSLNAGWTTPSTPLLPIRRRSIFGYRGGDSSHLNLNRHGRYSSRQYSSIKQIRGGSAAESDDEDEESEEDEDEEEEEASNPDTKLVSSLAKKNATAKKSILNTALKPISTSTSTTASNAITPARSSMVKQLVLTVVAMQVIKRIDLASPTVITRARFVYISYICSIHVLSFYVEFWGSRFVEGKDDVVVIPNALSSMISNGLSSAGGGSNPLQTLLTSTIKPTTTTISAYDKSQASNLRRSTLFPLAFMYYMHFRKGAVQPLVFQSVMGFYTLYNHPLFRIYVLGERGVGRPFIEGGGGGVVKEGEEEKVEEEKVVVVDDDDEEEEGVDEEEEEEEDGDDGSDESESKEEEEKEGGEEAEESEDE